jgi:hypothetical protein
MTNMKQTLRRLTATTLLAVMPVQAMAAASATQAVLSPASRAPQLTGAASPGLKAGAKDI